jgi:hypothetical protein
MSMLTPPDCPSSCRFCGCVNDCDWFKENVMSVTHAGPKAIQAMEDRIAILERMVVNHASMSGMTAEEQAVFRSAYKNVYPDPEN